MPQAVVDARNVVDTVIGDGGTEFDLHELVQRVFIFKRRLADAVAAAALAEIGFRVRLERLSPWSPVDEPMVKPKMYFVSSLWTALLSCACAPAAPPRNAAVAPIGTIKRRI